ncbi:J domain-containing protein [Pseudoscourfieldia marina]
MGVHIFPPPSLLLHNHLSSSSSCDNRLVLMAHQCVSVNTRPAAPVRLCRRRRHLPYRKPAFARANASSSSPSQLTTDDAVKILGIPPNASLDEVNAAYRTKIKSTHPDVLRGSGDAAAAAADPENAADARLVIAAAQVLRDAIERRGGDTLSLVDVPVYDVFDAPPDGAPDAFVAPFVNPFLCTGIDLFAWRDLDDAVCAALGDDDDAAARRGDPSDINAAARAVGAAPLPGSCAWLTPCQKASLGDILDEAVNEARILDDAVAARVENALIRARMCEMRGGAPPKGASERRGARNNTVSDDAFANERYRKDGYR